MLHEFVRTRWGWHTLHAPMPAASNFASLDPAEWQAIVDYVRGRSAATRRGQHATLAWITDPPAAPIRAELIGGNLSLWASLAGTPYAAAGAGKILFLEDIDEPFYRIDRMMVQLEQAGAFDGAAAIVLGDFTSCKDENNQCLADAATGEKKPLRKVFEQAEAFEQIFARLGQRSACPSPSACPSATARTTRRCRWARRTS